MRPRRRYRNWFLPYPRYLDAPPDPPGVRTFARLVRRRIESGGLTVAGHGRASLRLRLRERRYHRGLPFRVYPRKVA